MPIPMRIAVFSFVITFFVSLSYPLTVFFYLRKSTQPTRWIQNNPAYSIFLLSSFPAAVCVFSATINPQVISYWSSSWRLPVFCLAILITLVVVTFAVVDDFTSKPIAPYVLKAPQAKESSMLEIELRSARRIGGVSYRVVEPKRKAYQELIHLKSVQEILKRGSPVTYVHLALAWIVSLFVIGYFWYLAFLLVKTTHDGTHLLEGEKEKLVFIFGLLVTWFPMRLHTEWYQNEFHRPHWLKQYAAFWVLAFLALAYLLFVVLILKPQGTNVLIVTAAAPTMLAAVGKFKPEWLRSFGLFLASLPFIYFVGIYLVVLVVTGAMSAIRLIH